MIRRIALVSLLACSLFSGGFAVAAEERPAAAGTYVDRQEKRHAWRVSPGHALLWEDRPYLPVGAVFRPASLSATGDAAWERDVRALDAWRAAGVLDLNVRAERGLSAAPAGALARLIDALEERGFRYGIDVADRPQAPPRGFWLQPATIAVTAKEVAPGANSRWTVPIGVVGAESAVYALVDTSVGAPLRGGRVPVVDGRAEIEVRFRPANRMFPPGSAQLIVLPLRSLTAEEANGAPDLWASLPAYRDGLLRRLGEPRWGSGLRFFLDPLVVDAGLRGSVEDLLPSSDAYRVEFEAWLQRRGSANDVSVGWAFSDRHLTSLQVASRLVPLWRREDGGSGHAWFLDPETFDLYRVDRARSRYWDDLEAFRGDTARHAMNVIADVIKQRVAEVPVLYRWTQHHPVYTNPESVDGWDGLVASNEGQRVASSRDHTLAAALGYAQCEASARTLWSLAAGPDATGDTARTVTAIGARGYFVDPGPQGSAEGSPDPDPQPGTQSIRSLQSAIRDQEAVLVAEKPRVLFYPARRVTGVGVRRLANGVWWLPSYARGRSLILGDGLEGYRIDLPFADQPAPTTCVWSTSGARKATFVVPRDLPVAVYDAAGVPVKAKPKKGRLLLGMTESPYILTGLQTEVVFPVEAATNALAELESLLQLAETRRLNPNVLTALKAMTADAKAVFTERSAATAFDLIRGPLESLREFLTPYLWIEGERARDQSFSGIAPDPSASQGAYLVLNSSRDPGGGAYVARYSVNVNTAGLYDLWLAGSPPAQDGASPVRWEITAAEQRPTTDDRRPTTGEKAGGGTDLATPSVSRAATLTPGPAYAPGLAWTRLGSVRLDPGRYVLSLSISERGGERYLFRIDSLLLAREPFSPNGVQKPVWRVVKASR